MTDRADVAVVGAGLAGLALARQLSGAGLAVTVLESRTRVGGRLMTVFPEEPADRPWFDLGATWHWEDQPRVRALAVDLGVAAFAQYDRGMALHEPADGSGPVPIELPRPPAAYLRFVGGAQALCERLADQVPGGVRFGETVVEIVHDDPVLRVTSVGSDGSDTVLEAERVVLALPPRLVLQNVTVIPSLDEELVAVMAATPTWMGEAVKCVAVYESPFWRHGGLSGSAFSEVGPLSEVHDGSTHDASVGALWGFLATDHDLRSMPVAERVPLVLEQLGRLFGAEGADPVQYFERDWSGDPNTCEVNHHHGAALGYGHPRLGQPDLGGRLHLAGTETASEAGGHMEGALVSAERVARAILTES